MKNRYQLSTCMIAAADHRMNNETVKNLWRGFTLTCSVLTLQEGAENTFVLGSCEIPVLPEGKEYALSVTPEGAAVIGKDYSGLMRGYIALLMKISYTNLDVGQEDLFIEICREESRYRLLNFGVCCSTTQ